MHSAKLTGADGRVMRTKRIAGLLFLTLCAWVYTSAWTEVGIFPFLTAVAVVPSAQNPHPAAGQHDCCPKAPSPARAPRSPMPYNDHRCCMVQGSGVPGLPVASQQWDATAQSRTTAIGEVGTSAAPQMMSLVRNASMGHS